MMAWEMRGLQRDQVGVKQGSGALFGSKVLGQPAPRWAVGAGDRVEDN